MDSPEELLLEQGALLTFRPDPAGLDRPELFPADRLRENGQRFMLSSAEPELFPPLLLLLLLLLLFPFTFPIALFPVAFRIFSLFFSDDFSGFIGVSSEFAARDFFSPLLKISFHRFDAVRMGWFPAEEVIAAEMLCSDSSGTGPGSGSGSGSGSSGFGLGCGGWWRWWRGRRNPSEKSSSAEWRGD